MKCPFCGEEIQEDAVKCKYCKEWLSKPEETVQEPTQQPDVRLQEMGGTAAIKESETWFARYYKGILAAIIIVPMFLAIVIPLLLVTKQRTTGVQTRIEQAPSPALKPAPATEEATPSQAYETLILQADIPLGKPPAKAVDIFFKYKPEGSKRYVTEMLMQNVPVVSYSAAARQIEIRIASEDAENLKNASISGTIQVRPKR